MRIRIGRGARRAEGARVKTSSQVGGPLATIQARAASRCDGYRDRALIFVRLAHDRRFVVVVLFVAVLVVIFIRISGWHSVAHDQDGTPLDQAGAKAPGMPRLMLLLR
jgi:hypothetical protein